MSQQEPIPPQISPSHRALTDKLALACRILGHEGQNDTVYGHMSARANAAGQFWLKGAGLGLEEIGPDDLIRLDLDGQVLAGGGTRHLEYPIHSEIYRMRADVMAVVHTHPMYATVFGAILAELHPLMHEGSYFVPPPIPKFTRTSGLIVTAELGAAVTEVLGDHRALFLVNHGIVVVGASVEEACVGALLLDKACRTQLLAQGAGSFVWTSDAEARRKRAQIYTPQALQHMWQYYCRKLAPASV